MNPVAPAVAASQQPEATPTPTTKEAPPSKYITYENLNPANVRIGEIKVQDIPGTKENFTHVGIKYKHNSELRTLSYETPELTFRNGLQDMRSDKDIKDQDDKGEFYPKYVMTAYLPIEDEDGVPLPNNQANVDFVNIHTELWMAYRQLYFDNKPDIMRHPHFRVEPNPECKFTNPIHRIFDKGTGEPVNGAPRLFKIKAQWWKDPKDGKITATVFKLPDGTIIEDWDILFVKGFKAIPKIYYSYIYASGAFVRLQIKTRSVIITEFFDKPERVEQKGTMDRIQKNDPEAVNRILSQMSAYKAQKDNTNLEGQKAITARMESHQENSTGQPKIEVTMDAAAEAKLLAIQQQQMAATLAAQQLPTTAAQIPPATSYEPSASAFFAAGGSDVPVIQAAAAPTEVQMVAPTGVQMVAPTGVQMVAPTGAVAYTPPVIPGFAPPQQTGMVIQ